MAIHESTGPAVVATTGVRDGRPARGQAGDAAVESQPVERFATLHPPTGEIGDVYLPIDRLHHRQPKVVVVRIRVGGEQVVRGDGQGHDRRFVRIALQVAGVVAALDTAQIDVADTGGRLGRAAVAAEEQ